MTTCACAILAVGVDTGPPGADNTSAMHADTDFGLRTNSAHTTGTLSVDAAQALVSLLPVTTLSVPVVSVSPLVSITSIVIICPAGGVLG